MQDTLILVHGHSRPVALSFVLEGLRRQEALTKTQVWIDGHSNRASYLNRVIACARLEEKFPEASWMTCGSIIGHTKIFIDSVRRNLEQARNLIILEDDCFPAPHAIGQFEKALDEIRDNPEIFSVYGHHFGAADEGDETTAFQCWGWATTTAKLKPVLEEFDRLWRMPEPDFVTHMQDRLTPEIRRRMDVYPGRSESSLLDFRFCFDAVVAFLAAEAGMRHRKTPTQTVFNFGIGGDEGHFPAFDQKFVLPPFNMITEEDLVERFGLEHLCEPRQARWKLRLRKRLVR